MTKPVSRAARLAVYMLLCVGCASISLAITGFKFGTANNLFHVPYVLDLPATPQFSGDAFYASLKFYASLVWPAIRLVANEDNVYELFRAAHILSRLAAFAALLVLLRSSGLTSLRGLAACMSVLALTPWLREQSVVGEHGMFIEYFTHSELTWPFIFLSLALLAGRRTSAAAAMTGLTFAINAFVGVWALFVNAFSMLVDRHRPGLVGLTRASGIFALFACPAVLWVAVAAGSTDARVSFSYIDYIRIYYPNHFLIEATDVAALLKLALLFAAGLLAARHVPNSRYWTGVQFACLFLVLVAMPLPYLFDSRWIFNLHLLRSDGLEQAIAVIMMAMAGTNLLCAQDSHRRQLLGAVVLLSLAALDRHALDLAVVALALAAALSTRYARMLTWASLIGFALVGVSQAIRGETATAGALRLALIVSVIGLALYRGLNPANRRNAMVVLLATLSLVTSAAGAARRVQIEDDIPGAKRSWQDMVVWVRQSDVQGTFLLPLTRDADAFQLQARRRVWVDWKQGAAVMWLPSFHDQWMPRYMQVSALQSNEGFVHYAKKNAIPNVVLKTDTGRCPEGSNLVKATAYHVLCRVDP